MKTIKTVLTLCFLLQAAIAAPESRYPSGEVVLERIDRNMSSRNRIFTSQMLIHGRRVNRTIESKTWAVGEEKAFTTYLAPAREKGIKMLKLGDKLWMYSPATDRTIKISGHMLRQSMMGSDLSFEDMMEDARLQHRYNAVVTHTETISGRPCWVLKLSAKTENIAYYTRKLWVDQKRNIPLREELYARSGKLLKKLELNNVTRIQGRWFPRQLLFKDMLKKGKGTEFRIVAIQFDQDIPKRFFSKAVLRK